MPNSANDPLRVVSEQARGTLLRMLEECGIDTERFEGLADSELSLEELSNTMGKVWAFYGRACSIEEEWKKKHETLKLDREGVFARAYAEAAMAAGPKSTETAKKNWIVENWTELGEIDRQIIEIEYLMGMMKAARKALEFRCNMLQSVNKLKITEMEKIHFESRLNTEEI